MADQSIRLPFTKAPAPASAGAGKCEEFCHASSVPSFALCLQFWWSACCRPRRFRSRQAGHNQYRLGDIQSGLHPAQEQGLAGKGDSRRTTSRSAGCRRSDPTRLSNSSTGSIDFGSSAGSAALVAKINGNPIKSIYVYSRPEWTALVTRKDTSIASIADLKGGKRP